MHDIITNEKLKEILLFSKDALVILDDCLDKIFGISIPQPVSAKPFFDHTFVVYADTSGFLRCIDRFTNKIVYEYHLNGFVTDQIIHYKNNVLIFPLVVPVQINKSGLSHYCICEFSLDDFTITKHPLQRATLPKIAIIDYKIIVIDSEKNYVFNTEAAHV